ncbi:MAG: hypothetical protein RLZZ609_829 [Cyanobacteriota bacterium]|jgi:hypothetical protein
MALGPCQRMFGALAGASFHLGKGDPYGGSLTQTLVTALRLHVRCEPAQAWTSVLTTRSGSFSFTLPSQRLPLRQGDREHILTSQDSLALELSAPGGESGPAQAILIRSHFSQ